MPITGTQAFSATSSSTSNGPANKPSYATVYACGFQKPGSRRVRAKDVEAFYHLDTVRSHAMSVVLRGVIAVWRRGRDWRVGMMGVGRLGLWR
jgi:plasmid replication initiation protein